eukprot:COSAG01_NODE_2242_length_8077_cov_35.739544_7_plen_94_part_00
MTVNVGQTTERMRPGVIERALQCFRDPLLRRPPALRLACPSPSLAAAYYYDRQQLHATEYWPYGSAVLASFYKLYWVLPKKSYWTQTELDDHP